MPDQLEAYRPKLDQLAELGRTTAAGILGVRTQLEVAVSSGDEEGEAAAAADLDGWITALEAAKATAVPPPAQRGKGRKAKGKE